MQPNHVGGAALPDHLDHLFRGGLQAHDLEGVVDTAGDQFPYCSYGIAVGGVDEIGCTELRRELELVGLDVDRPEEHTSELQSLISISSADFCLVKKIETEQLQIHSHNANLE